MARDVILLLEKVEGQRSGDVIDVLFRFFDEGHVVSVIPSEFHGVPFSIELSVLKGKALVIKVFFDGDAGFGKTQERNVFFAFEIHASGLEGIEVIFCLLAC